MVSPNFENGKGSSINTEGGAVKNYGYGSPGTVLEEKLKFLDRFVNLNSNVFSKYRIWYYYLSMVSSI